MGDVFDPNLIHDHNSFPQTEGHGHEMTPEEQTQMLGLAPTLTEMVQRHDLYYRVKERNYDRLDHIVVGLHIEGIRRIAPAQETHPSTRRTAPCRSRWQSSLGPWSRSSPTRTGAGCEGTTGAKFGGTRSHCRQQLS